MPTVVRILGFVSIIVGKVIHIVMMGTTMKDANGMVETVVGTMSTQNTAQFVNALIQMLEVSKENIVFVLITIVLIIDLDPCPRRIRNPN